MRAKDTELWNTEGTVVGSWLQGLRTDDMDLCVPSDFTAFAPAVRLMKQGEHDLFTICSKAEIQLSDIAPFLQYASDVLYESSYQQVLTQKQKRILENAQGKKGKDFEKTLDIVQRISDRKRNGVTKFEESKGILNSMIEEVDRRAKEPIVTWGIPTLDNRMVNVMRGELTTIAARPSVGKSTIMLQIARHIAAQDKKVLFFPLEMTPQALFWRIVLSETGVSSKGVKTGRFTEQEFERLSIGFDIVNQIEQSGNLKIFTEIYKVEDIQAAVNQHKPYAVFIDQLTQVDAHPAFENVRGKINYITRNLKRIAKNENTAVVLACQINRSAQNRIPTIADLKESGSIEEDSDNVILLHRYTDEYAAEHGLVYDPQKAKPMRVEVAKQREGETGYDDMISSLGRFQFMPIEFRSVAGTPEDVPF